MSRLQFKWLFQYQETQYISSSENSRINVLNVLNNVRDITIRTT